MLGQPSKTYLTVKANSLRDESALIKGQEAKWRRKAAIAREKQKNNSFSEQVRQELYLHRVNVLRPESRALNIARAYMQGRPYTDVERSFHMTRFGLHNKDLNDATFNLFKRAAEIAFKYGKFDPPDTNIPQKQYVYNDFIAWLKLHPQSDMYNIVGAIRRLETLATT